MSVCGDDQKLLSSFLFVLYKCQKGQRCIISNKQRGWKWCLMRPCFLTDQTGRNQQQEEESCSVSLPREGSSVRGHSKATLGYCKFNMHTMKETLWRLSLKQPHMHCKHTDVYERKWETQTHSCSKEISALICAQLLATHSTTQL